MDPLRALSSQLYIIIFIVFLFAELLGGKIVFRITDCIVRFSYYFCFFFFCFTLYASGRQACVRFILFKHIIQI